MLQQVEDASKEKFSVKEISKLVSSSEDTVVLGVFGSAEGELFQTWLDAGKSFGFEIYPCCMHSEHLEKGRACA